jgi:hypothetical protein
MYSILFEIEQFESKTRVVISKHTRTNVPYTLFDSVVGNMMALTATDNAAGRSTWSQCFAYFAFALNDMPGYSVTPPVLYVYIKTLNDFYHWNEIALYVNAFFLIFLQLWNCFLKFRDISTGQHVR